MYCTYIYIYMCENVQQPKSPSFDGARVHHSCPRRERFHVREKVRPFDGLTERTLFSDW